MLSHLIWSSSIVLGILLLVRGFQTRLFLKYPFFFGYVSFVLLFDDVVSFFISRWDRHLYIYTFWITEFIGVLIGCGVVFEIYRIGLARYPGTARMARNALALVFVVAAAKGLLDATNSSVWWLEANTLEVERMLRTVQAVAIVTLAVVFLIYSISFGKNLRGILLGYGLYVSGLAVSLTFFPGEGHGFWWHALSASYLVAFLPWLVYLWTFREVKVEEPDADALDRDYQTVANTTRQRLQAERGQLARAARP